MEKAVLYLKIICPLILVLLIGALAFAWWTGQLLSTLYVVLIFLAFFSLLSTTLLLYALIKLLRTITVIRVEMKPLLASLDETIIEAKQTLDLVKNTAQSAGKTASTVASTAKLTQEFAVAPMVRAASVAVAGTQVLRIFTGKGKARNRYEQRKRQQAELLARMNGNGGE